MTSPGQRLSEAEVNAYIDGELALEDRDEVEGRLAASPADADYVHDIRELNEAMRARYAARLAEPLPAPMLALLGRVPRWPPALATRQAAVVAGLLVGLAGAAVGYAVRSLVAEAPRPEPSFVENAIGAHSVYVPEVRHPVEVRAAEEHLVRWLANRVGAPVRAPSLSDLGWKLMGGRLLPDAGAPAAQFMYEDAGGRRLTLYIRKETGLDNTAFRFYQRNGYGAFYWIDRPLAYALAGRLPRNELLAVANAVYGQLERR